MGPPGTHGSGPFKTYFLLTVTEIFLAVKKMMRTEDTELIIAVSELLVIVIGAMMLKMQADGF